MARIRVNTEDLKTKAKDFDSAAEAFTRAGDDILAAAMAMPSYDGQLSGPARKAGYEIQSQARALGAALAGDAEFLRKAAQDFENVNNQAIDVFNQNQEMLLAAGSPPFITIEGGDSYLGYKYLGGEPPVYILCMYGVCKKVIVTDGNLEAIQYFILQVDGGSYTDPETGIKMEIKGYFDAKDDYDKATITAIGGALVVIGSGLALVFTAGAVIPVAAGTAAGGATTYAGAVYFQQQFADEMATATNNAATAWNEIFPGDNQVGDSQYNTFDQGSGAGRDVYEPPDVPYTPPPTFTGDIPISGAPDYGGLSDPHDESYTPSDNSATDNENSDSGNTTPETGYYQ